MRKGEPVDEYAETEVLIQAENPADREADALLLYAEYESELTDDAPTRRDLRTRRR